MSSVQTVNFTSYNFVSEEERKRKEDQATLLLSSLSEAINKLPTTPPKEEGLEGQLKSAMAEMQEALGTLETLYSELQSFLGSNQSQSSQFATNLMQSLSSDKIANLAKEAIKEHRMDILKKVFMAFEIIAAAVVSVVSVITGNPEVAVAVVALTILSVSGALNKLTSAISNRIQEHLQKDGMDSDTASKLASALASIIVIAITVVVTLGVGAVAGAISAPEEAAEAGADEVIGSIEEGGEEAASEGTDSESSAFSRVMKKAIKLAIMNGTQVMGSTGFLTDVVDAAMSHSKNQKAEHALEVIAEVVQVVLTIVTAIIGGGGESSGVKNIFTDLTDGLKSVADDDTASSIMKGTQAATQVLTGAPEVAMGGITIKLGKLQEVLGELQGALTIIENLMQQIGSDIKKLGGNNDPILNTFSDLIQEVSEYTQGMQAASNVVGMGI